MISGKWEDLREETERPLESQVVEGAELVGSAVVTAGVAVVLAVVAVPVSLGLGAVWGAHWLGRKLTGKEER